MKHGWTLIAGCFLIISSVSSVLAGNKELKNEPWRKFGTIVLKLKKDAEEVLFKTTRYKNGEYMSESNLTGEYVRHLYVIPSRFSLYSGGSTDLAEQKNISLQSSFMIEYALMSLSAAFPDGPASVTFDTVENTGVIDKKNTKVTVTATRSNSHEIKYNLKSNDMEDAEVSGVWDDQLQEPLPDDFSVTGWNHASPAQINKLLEARSVQLMPTSNKK